MLCIKELIRAKFCIEKNNLWSNITKENRNRIIKVVGITDAFVCNIQFQMGAVQIEIIYFKYS